MEEPVPAPAWTNTSWPRPVNSCTPAGVMATRYSLSLTSVGIPIRISPPSSRSGLQDLPGALQHVPEDLLDLVEVGLVAGQRRGDLDDGVATVVGAAVEAGVEQRLGQEPAQQPLRLVVVEGLLGRLVLDQLDPVEVAVAAHVADDRQVQQLLEGGPEGALLVPHVLAGLLPVEDVERG